MAIWRELQTSTLKRRLRSGKPGDEDVKIAVACALRTGSVHKSAGRLGDFRDGLMSFCVTLLPREQCALRLQRV